MRKKRWESWFRGEKKRAARLLEDPVAVLRSADLAGQKAQSARGALSRLWDELQTAIRLVRAWGRRDYQGVKRRTLVLLVGGLLYFVSPIDAILDAIPVLGLIDDAAVLGWVFRRVSRELEDFRRWEADQHPQSA